jgi:hypothetical protein
LQGIKIHFPEFLYGFMHEAQQTAGIFSLNPIEYHQGPGDAGVLKSC